MKLRLDLLERLTMEDIAEVALTQIRRAKFAAKPVKTGKFI